MRFVDALVQESLPVWEACLESPFLRGIQEGTLSQDCFLGYLVEDSLYLREYAKVFAWGMTKAKTMEEIRTYYSLLSFVNESEDATRLAYLRRFGIQDAQIQKLPMRPENAAYTQRMIQAAQDGNGAPECMMACLPCMVSYAWLFQRLLKQAPQVRETLYWPLVRDYASESYQAACDRWMDFTEQVCTGLSPERLENCRAIFYDCSVHELHFWQMSEYPRTDLPTTANIKK